MFAAMNLPTLITLIIVVALLSLAVWHLYRQAKETSSSCGCGSSCTSCPTNGCAVKPEEKNGSVK